MIFDDDGFEDAGLDPYDYDLYEKYFKVIQEEIGGKVMAYAFGFMLPIIGVIGGGILLLTAIAEDASDKRDIQRMVDENSRAMMERHNKR